LTTAFPDTERYGRTPQMRRAAASVPANIADGAARSGTRELIRFLRIATGWLSGLDTLIELAVKLEYIADARPIQK